MNYCKDCKFWRDGGECDKIGNDILMRDPDSFFQIVATADDDSGLDVYLKTGPLFGCNQHSPKD